jgi:POT family proton-dependent oligopeptide transporter
MGETVAAAGLHAEMIDEKRASMAAERRASVVTDPHAPAAGTGSDAAVSAGGVTADGQFPTPEEMQSLRRISNKIPMKLFSIAFIELCERFSYYGCTVVCKFCDNPNPERFSHSNS